MICLNHEYTCLPDSFSDQGRDKSEIGYPCQTRSGVKQIARSPFKIKPNWIISIVGYAKWMNLEFLKLKGLTRFKAFPASVGVGVWVVWLQWCPGWQRLVGSNSEKVLEFLHCGRCVHGLKRPRTIPQYPNLPQKVEISVFFQIVQRLSKY